MTPPEGGQSNWIESALWKFSGGADGAEPLFEELLPTTKRISPRTTLYGSTGTGGASNAGTVFALTGKKLTTLWAYTGGSDGSYPEGAVVADKSGALYVTAQFGGGQSNCGTVIKLSPPAKGRNTWTESTIWTFTDGNDGCYPADGLLIDKSGVLYGSAGNGGTNGVGTVFALLPPQGQHMAWAEQTLWSFTGGVDGANPETLTAGKSGVLYGMTYSGGSNQVGAVFSLTPPNNGKGPYAEQTLWSFTGGKDGSYPLAPVTLDKSGALYGTTSYGANNNNGSVFKVTPPAQGQGAWTETTLWDFSGIDGSSPGGGLTPDKNGVLYGTTYAGGTGTNCDDPAYGCGVAYSLAGTGFAP
jgi:uncharacterized repeat protein (TIGR03803 family)